MTLFDQATTVVARGGGLYDAEVSGNFTVGDKPNGGYLMALVARALRAEAGKPDPLSMTAHFLLPSAPGPATVDVEAIRSGRLHATMGARLDQDGSERLRALAVFGDLSSLDGPTVVSGRPRELTALEDCVPARPELPGGVRVPLMEQFDTRLDPRTVGWARGAPGGKAEIGAWVRFAGGRAPDLLGLLLIVDALPPAVFGLGLGGWVPTLELTTHLRAHPRTGWLRVWVRTRFLMGGYLEEDAEVWDSGDTLVAMSRQLALISARTSP